MKRSAVLRAMYAGTRLSRALLRLVDEGMPSVGELNAFPLAEVVPSHPDRALKLALAEPFSRLGLLTDTLAIGADGSGNTWLVAIAGALNTVYLHDHDSDEIHAVANGLAAFARFMSLLERRTPPTRVEQTRLRGKIRFVPELGIELSCKPPTGGPRVPAALARQLRATSELRSFFDSLESLKDDEMPGGIPRLPGAVLRGATPGAVVAELLRAFLHDRRELLDSLVERVGRSGPPWLLAAGRFLQRHHEKTPIARARILMRPPVKQPSSAEVIEQRAAMVWTDPATADDLDLGVLLDEWLAPRLDDGSAIKKVAAAIEKLVTRDSDFIGRILVFGHRVGKTHPHAAIALYDAVLATTLPKPNEEGRADWLRVLNNAINTTFDARNFAASKRLCDLAAPYGAENPYIFHGAACTYVAIGELGKAARQLTLAVEHDYEHLDKMCSDDDLAPLRDRPEFAALAAAVKRRAAAKANQGRTEK